MAHELKEEEIQLVVFLLNQVEFACYIEHVREVLKVKVTPLPKTPQFVEGVVNLRGEVIPVIDLRKRFDLPVVEDKENRIIIVEVGSNVIGLIVDAVKEVLRSKIQSPPSGLTGASSKLIKGIGNLGERLLIILNLEYILSTEEQLALEDITAAGRSLFESR